MVDIEKIATECVDTFGEDSQFKKAIQELNEYAVILSKFAEGRATMEEVASEEADVIFVGLKQIELMLNRRSNGKYSEYVKRELEFKVNRMIERIENYKEMMHKEDSW
jgi:hypothetical protein